MSRKTSGADLPNIDELDALLVRGETKIADDTGRSHIVFPSYRDLADRFGTSHTQIARYAKAHNCLERRRQIQSRARAKADEQVTQVLAEAMAFNRTERLKLIDRSLMQYAKALEQGRIRVDSVADLNTLLRLHEAMSARTDDVSEGEEVPTLERMQQAYERYIQAEQDVDESMSGMVHKH